MPYKAIDLRKVKTYPIHQRQNLVKFTNLVMPDTPTSAFTHPEFNAVVEKVLDARRNGRPVIWMMGGHVIKCGLGPLLIELMRAGVVTHIAGNGSVSIHDLELAMIGETSEDVATSIEDGTFGMAHETGAAIHKALRQGVKDGLGYGESVGRLIDEQEYPFRQYSVQYQAYKLGVPMTVHVTVGADIVHQHPDCDFGVLGAATGLDFKIFCASVANLENGVFLNFGSAVTGPEVFLKAVSITRNLGYSVQGLTTANFDLMPLGKDYHAVVAKDNPEYFYRPRKNVVNRPTSLHGRGYHIRGDHSQTIPTLYHSIHKQLEEMPLPAAINQHLPTNGFEDAISRVSDRSPLAAQAVRELIDRRPHLTETADALCQAYLMIAESLERGGTLFLCGNGGSMADAQHISGELLKSFGRKRPLCAAEKMRFMDVKDGQFLADQLEGGLRAVVLGSNLVLTSAVDNDFEARGLSVAQELNALVKTGDVLLGISTSGKANNVYYAAVTARARGAETILLTGVKRSRLSEFCDLTIQAPAMRTDLIQEEHIALYHCLCEMLERDFFGA